MCFWLSTVDDRFVVDDCCCCYRYIGLTSALAFEFRNAHTYRNHFDVAIAAVSAELSYKESASHPLPAESSAGCLRFNKRFLQI